MPKSNGTVLIYYDKIREAESAAEEMNGTYMYYRPIRTTFRTWTKTT